MGPVHTDPQEFCCGKPGIIGSVCSDYYRLGWGSSVYLMDCGDPGGGRNKHTVEVMRLQYSTPFVQFLFQAEDAPRLRCIYIFAVIICSALWLPNTPLMRAECLISNKPGLRYNIETLTNPFIVFTGYFCCNIVKPTM